MRIDLRKQPEDLELQLPYLITVSSRTPPSGRCDRRHHDLADRLRPAACGRTSSGSGFAIEAEKLLRGALSPSFGNLDSHSAVTNGRQLSFPLERHCGRDTDAPLSGHPVRSGGAVGQSKNCVGNSDRSGMVRAHNWPEYRATCWYPHSRLTSLSGQRKPADKLVGQMSRPSSKVTRNIALPCRSCQNMRGGLCGKVRSIAEVSR